MVLFAVLHWSHELHLLLLEGAVESLIAHVAEAVNGHLSLALSKQDGINGDIVHALALAKVVDQIARTQHVQRSQTAILSELKLGRRAT
jgi:hypothetical protein